MLKCLSFQLDDHPFKRRKPETIPDASFANFPPDLFPHIVSLVSDQSTLYALSLTSRYFDELATPYLYREVYLGNSRAAKSFIKYAPYHLKSKIKTLHIHFKLPDWEVRIDKFKKRHARQVDLSQLDQLDTLIITSEGIQTSYDEKNRYTSFSMLFEEWTDIFVSPYGSRRFEGRHMDQKSREGDVIWSKFPLFERINNWTRMEYLDLPIMPHPKRVPLGNEIIPLPSPSTPLPSLKQITFSCWNFDRFHIDGGYLLDWLDLLASLVQRAAERKHIGGRLVDGENDNRIILKIRDPSQDNTLFLLEKWIMEKEERIGAYKAGL